MVASRCPSSTTSRAGPVSGMSCAICLRVQVSAAPSPEGWGVKATIPGALCRDEPVQSPPTSRFDCADTHSEATLDLAEQPGSELLVRWVLFLDHFQHLIMDVGQQLQELAVVHSPPPDRPRDRSGRLGQIVDGYGQQKKRPEGPLFLQRSRSDVVVLDLGDIGGVMVVGPAIHAASHEVIDHPGDGQNEEQEDQVAGYVERPAEQPENDQDDDDRPDETRQNSSPP